MFNQQTTHPNEPTDPIQTTEPLKSNDGPDDQIENPNPPPTTTTRRGRPRGRPPARRNQLPTSSSRTTTSSRKPTTRPRRGLRTRFSSRTAPRTLDRAMTLPQIPESSSPAHPPQLDDNSRQAPRYQLRTNRAPKYKCGTCGSRDCSCVQLVTTETPKQRLARGAAIPDCEFLLAQKANHPQHKILNVRTKLHNPNITPTDRHIISTIEKTFTSTESESIPPLESTLKEMHQFSPSDCPTYRFKEWTSHEKGGLEFTLAAIIPPLPPSFSFGELDDTCGNPLMIRCITANQLWQKYHITSPPGDVYQPSTGWWHLVTSLDDSSLVSPTTLLLCLENLRTLVESNDTLCFHLADIYRGKFLSRHWLQLIAIIFCRQTKICILDRLTYTPEMPISPLEALTVMHSWSCVHMSNRPPASHNMGRSQSNFCTLDVKLPRKSCRRNWKMAHLTTKDSPKPRVLDHLLRHGYPASLWHISVVLSRRPPIPISNYSIYHSRIWTRNYLPSKTFGWRSHLLAVLPHGTLVQSNLPPIHQSLH